MYNEQNNPVSGSLALIVKKNLKNKRVSLITSSYSRIEGDEFEFIGYKERFIDGRVSKLKTFEFSTLGSEKIPVIKKIDGVYKCRIIKDKPSRQTTKTLTINDCVCKDHWVKKKETKNETQKKNQKTPSENKEYTTNNIENINKTLRKNNLNINLKDIVFIKDEAEIENIKKQLKKEEKILAINEKEDKSYLVSFDDYEVLDKTPSYLTKFFGLTKELSIVGLIRLKKFNDFLVKKITIKEKHWNKELKTGYSDELYSYVSLLFTEKDFAYFSGIYNSIITILNVGESAQEIIDIIKNPLKIYDLISSLKDIDKLLESELEKYNKGNIYEKSYKLGEYSALLPTLVLSAKSGIKLVNKIKNVLKKPIKFTSKKAILLYKNFSAKLKAFLEKAPKGFTIEVLENESILFYNKNKLVASRTPEGNLYQGDYRKKKIGKGKKIEGDETDLWDEIAEYGDAGGLNSNTLKTPPTNNTLASKFSQYGNFPQIAQLVKDIKKYPNLAKHITNEFAELLVKSGKGNPKVLAQLGKLADKNLIKKFADDLNNPKFAKELFGKIDGNPDLIDAWGTLAKNPNLRKKISNLESISKWIKEIPQQKISDCLSKSKSKQKLLDEIGVAKSKYHALVLIKDYDNIPGVVKGIYIKNGSKLSDKEKLPINWTDDVDLPSSEIENFTGKIKPLELKEGDKIYRVSHANGASGAYWTLNKPEKLRDIIGGTAVRPEWNNFEYIHEYTVPRNKTIKAWVGKTARQEVSEIPSNYHLPGGDKQLFINYIAKQDLDFQSIVKSSKIEW